jgi:hypothetical protein
MRRRRPEWWEWGIAGLLMILLGALLMVQSGCCRKPSVEYVDRPVEVPVPCSIPSPESLPTVELLDCDGWEACLDAENLVRLYARLKALERRIELVETLCGEGPEPETLPVLD